MSMMVQSGRFGGGVAPVVGTTFDPADSDVGLTLSNGDKTVTATTTGFKSARPLHGKGTGKWRFQVTIDAFVGAELGIGVSGPFYTRGIYLGYDRQGINYVRDNRVVYNGATAGNGAGAYTTGAVIDVYVDATARKVWFAKNGVVSGDPTAGTGGYTLHASFVASIFPHVYLHGAGCEVTIETDGAWDYPGAHPTFLPWSAEQAATKAAARGFLIVSRGPALYYAHALAEIGLLQSSGGTNIVAGGTGFARASGSGSNPGLMLDGNVATYWEDSPGGGPNQYPSYFGAYAAAPAAVTHIMLQSRPGFSGEAQQAPTLTDIYLSADDKNFDKVQVGYDWGAWMASSPAGPLKEYAIPDF